MEVDTKGWNMWMDGTSKGLIITENGQSAHKLEPAKKRENTESYFRRHQDLMHKVEDSRFGAVKEKRAVFVYIY